MLKPVKSYTYIEHGSKNNPGERKTLKYPNKHVTQFAFHLKERCHCVILDQYIVHFSQNCRQDSFYLKLLPTLPSGPKTAWYYPKNVIRKKVLATMVQCMFDEAGIATRKTNHSLRVASAT